MSDSEATEISDVSPSSLKHLVGQRSVIDQVSVAIDAAFEDGQRMDDALLVGPPGLGKSQFASVIAQELATDFREVLGQSIKTPADLNDLLLSATDKAVLHIDEAHELDKKLQTGLYLALDKRAVVVSGGKCVHCLPIEDCTLLLSTTDEYSLLQPLRDRMRLTLRFEFYSNEELITVLRHRCQALRWTVDEQTFSLIAQRARGTPRWALRFLQSCRRVCRAEGKTTITLDHLQRACELEQLDGLGLGPIEQRYLQIVADGASRLNVVASRLALPPRTVSQITEPFLIRVGLIVKDDQGRRQLTAMGRDHLSNSRQKTV